MNSNEEGAFMEMMEDLEEKFGGGAAKHYYVL